MDNTKNTKLPILPIVVVVCILAVIGAVVAFTTSTARADIDPEMAKKIALEDAKIDIGSAVFIKTKLDSDSGRKVYDVEFYTDGIEYDYEIDAKTGEILEKDTDIENFNVKDVAQAKKDSMNTSSQISTEAISPETAKNTAVSDAGFKMNQVSFVKEALTTDDGRQIYDIEFYVNNMEYDYEIDASTGKILEKDWDIEDFAISQTPSSPTSQAPANNVIDAEKAKAISLSHAGIQAAQATFLKANLDADDGQKVYDVEFQANGMEYDYEIDAETGSVLSADMDKI